MVRKGQNRVVVDSTDFSLPRSKVLRGKRNFDRLFERSTTLRTPSLQLKYRIYDDPEENCLMGFIAPKKQFKHAVDRNNMKRLLREAYRQHQQILTPLFNQETFGLHAVLIAQKQKADYHQVESDVVELLTRLKKNLEKRGYHAQSSKN